MANKQITKASQLKGLSIYQDPKRGTVFYDVFTKRAFNLTSSDVGTYQIYSALLPFAIIVAFLCMSIFSIDMLTTLLIILGIYIIGAILFRIFFFYKKIEIENYKPTTKNTIPNYLADNYSTATLFVLVIMLLLLTVMTPVYANLTNMNIPNLIASYFVALVTFAFAIFSSIAIYTKKKNNL